METETRNTIPLWLAVAITVCVSLPFGIWLDKYNLPLWAAFIVWAQYFAMGAKPSALKTVIPAYIIGVIGAALIMTAYSLLSTQAGAGTILSVGEWNLTNDNIALFAACLVGFCILIYAMKWMPVTQTGITPSSTASRCCSACTSPAPSSSRSVRTSTRTGCLPPPPSAPAWPACWAARSAGSTS